LNVRFVCTQSQSVSKQKNGSKALLDLWLTNRNSTSNVFASNPRTLAIDKTIDSQNHQGTDPIQGNQFKGWYSFSFKQTRTHTLDASLLIFPFFFFYLSLSFSLERSLAHIFCFVCPSNGLTCVFSCSRFCSLYLFLPPSHPPSLPP